MSYLELAQQVMTERDGQAEATPADGGPCARCQALEAQGVRILFCSICGRRAELPPPREPQPRDLAYSLAHVREHLPELSQADRETVEYWLDLYLDAGWSPEVAERAAFQRAVRPPPAKG